MIIGTSCLGSFYVKPHPRRTQQDMRASSARCFSSDVTSMQFHQTWLNGSQ